MINRKKNQLLYLVKYMQIFSISAVLLIANDVDTQAKQVEQLTNVKNVFSKISEYSKSNYHSDYKVDKQEALSKEIALVDVNKQKDSIQYQQQSELNRSNDDEVWVPIDEMPAYPGGSEVMFQFIKDNLKYPDEAVKKKIEGMVKLSFVISKTGKIEEIKVYQSITPSLDNEAIRILKLMPTWKPGKYKGENVSVKFILPFMFSLENFEKKNNEVSKDSDQK